MKGFTAILLIYVLGLMLVPCFDDPNHQDDTTVNIESIFNGSHSELCSPFCADHDCHTHITISFVNSMFVAEQFSKAVNVEVTTTISSPFFAIWQPPKIS